MVSTASMCPNRCLHRCMHLKISKQMSSIRYMTAQLTGNYSDCTLFSFLEGIRVTMKLYITLQVNMDCLPNLPSIKIMLRTPSIIFQLSMVLVFALIIAAVFCESSVSIPHSFHCVLQALKMTGLRILSGNNKMLSVSRNRLLP